MYDGGGVTQHPLHPNSKKRSRLLFVNPIKQVRILGALTHVWLEPKQAKELFLREFQKSSSLKKVVQSLGPCRVEVLAELLAEGFYGSRNEISNKRKMLGVAKRRHQEVSLLVQELRRKVLQLNFFTESLDSKPRLMDFKAERLKSTSEDELEVIAVRRRSSKAFLYLPSMLSQYVVFVEHHLRKKRKSKVLQDEKYWLLTLCLYVDRMTDRKHHEQIAELMQTFKQVTDPKTDNAYVVDRNAVAKMISRYKKEHKTQYWQVKKRLEAWIEADEKGSYILWHHFVCQF